MVQIAVERTLNVEANDDPEDHISFPLLFFCFLACLVTVKPLKAHAPGTNHLLRL